MSRIGFVLITHTAPAQILRLLRALEAVYGDPTMAIHHDFDQCPVTLIGRWADRTPRCSGRKTGRRISLQERTSRGSFAPESTLRNRLDQYPAEAR